jgi:hypothetical protein
MSLTLKVFVSPLVFFQLISKVDFSFSAALLPIATVAINTHAPIFFIFFDLFFVCYFFYEFLQYILEIILRFYYNLE